jgi:hypothetical protein
MDRQDLLEKVRRINDKGKEDKERIRRQLEEQINEFFKKGGKIEEVPRPEITSRGMWYEGD